jgi:hypothetical protein
VFRHSNQLSALIFEPLAQHRARLNITMFDIFTLGLLKNYKTKAMTRRQIYKKNLSSLLLSWIADMVASPTLYFHTHTTHRYAQTLCTSRHLMHGLVAYHVSFDPFVFYWPPLLPPLACHHLKPQNKSTFPCLPSLQQPSENIHTWKKICTRIILVQI